MKGRKPKNKKVLTLYFDTDLAVDRYIGWYLESGEQDCRYFTEGWGKDWMYLKPDDDACPECQSDETDEINSFFYKNRKIREKDVTCNNCGHIYKVENIYGADGK